MKNPPFVSGSYYHLYNRGVEKRTIFQDRRDYLRFLETLEFYRNSPQPMKLSDYRRGVVKFKKNINQNEAVKIFCFCLMPNHFHLLVKQITEDGITQFLRKVSDSYTKYFNIKHDRVGPLFQGSFKAKHIENDEYLLQLSKYIHRNSFPLKMWEGKVYPYSSYKEYTSGERHIFCDTDFILSYFSKSNPERDYQSFVEEANNIDPELFDSLIDLDD